MAETWKYLLFATLSISLDVGLGLQCPDGCDCPTSISVTCRNMRTVPKNYTMQEVIILNLSFNSIDTLEEEAFFSNDLANLQILDLSHNLIIEINPKAFYGMNNLKDLYLQYNKLERIDPDTFAPLKNLVVLKLNDNSIKEFDNSTFQSLKLLKNLSISILGKFDEALFEPIRSLVHLDIHFPNVKMLSRNETQRVENWASSKNITTRITCGKSQVFKANQRRNNKDSTPFRKIHFNTPYSRSLTNGEYVIGIVITVGILLLLISSLVVLSVIVRQAEKVTDENDEFSYMSDFEPYRGHLSPTKSKSFNWSKTISQDNIPIISQEVGIEPKEESFSNGYLEGVKIHVDNEDKSLKNSS